MVKLASKEIFRNTQPGARNIALTRARSRVVGYLQAESSPKLKIKRILVPIDFSAPSLKALRYAQSFAEQFGATICLVHVVEPAFFVHDLRNVPLVKSDKEVVNKAKARLITLARKKTQAFVPVRPQGGVGKPFHEIAAAASKLKADLIIIATHGFTGLKHTLLGSTAERVARYAPCPVLVVRAQGNRKLTDPLTSTLSPSEGERRICGRREHSFRRKGIDISHSLKNAQRISHDQLTQLQANI